MATWDGSYPEPEETDYFVYSNNQNPPNTAARNWSYFTDNTNVMFPQDQRDFHSRYNNQLGYKRDNSTNFYHQVDPRTLPTSTMPLQNTYQEHTILPSASLDNTQVSNLQYFPESVRTLEDTSTFSHNTYDPRFRSNSESSKFPMFPLERDSIQTSIVENSKLHPTVNEFIPNDVMFKKDKFNQIDNPNDITRSNSNTSIRHSKTKLIPTHVSSSNNRYKGERYYHKKDIDYKQKNFQDTQFPNEKGSYRMYNTRNYNKFQNDKHYNKRYQPNQSSVVIHDSDKPSTSTDSTYSIVSDGQKDITSIERIQKDELSSNTDLNKNTGRTLIHGNKLEKVIKRCMQQQNNKPKRFISYTNTWNAHKQDSNHAQYESDVTNMKKYSDTGDVRSNRYEGSRKNRKNNVNVYNGYRGNYSKNNGNEKPDYKERNDKVVTYKEKTTENWRDKAESNEVVSIQKKSLTKIFEIDDDASQRERLTEQLNRGLLECLVCYEHIKQSDYIWSCNNCYHALHLKCIKKWATSSQSDKGWRCPACQNVSSVIPVDYFCFCGKMKTPEWNRKDAAHSCGEVCARNLSKNNCIHKCTLLCHPGSCPPCDAMVIKYCGCGQMSQTLQCSIHKLLFCDSICGKDLMCEKHTCEKICHHGECEPCDKTIKQNCFCGKKNQEVPCRANVPSTYSCDNTCDKLLDCGKHYCQKVCHPECCESCSLMPEKITTCCCGQTPLTEKRESCLDHVPVCDKICSKRLKCGQPSNPHTCKIPCHTGKCPDCDLSTDVKCRCGNMDREIACRDLTSKADDARCEKRCTRKRSCGKHKCNQQCCIDIDHICPLLCPKTLSCGRHKCEQQCHKGRCQPCWRSSFDELYCECGAEVIYPPVPCGTRRPSCNRPCSRQHSCNHQVLHNCHSELTCPPCSVLTQRWCHGRHELRKAVPCHITEISCGLPCNKPLTCGRHKCIAICHSGPCERPGQQCVQPCVIARETCGHICAAPCHEGKCPEIACKEIVKVTCQCGNKSMNRTCAENSYEYQRIASSILASKMADMQLGHSVNLEEVFGQGTKKQNQLKTLECNDECKLIERNRRLALGFQIINPDLSGKLLPRYNDYMKQWAKKDPHFCQMVHDKITELVHLAKSSKHKSRSYSFDSMNRDKRHFVHDSCEHFGCESQAYDKEPKRNVVVTAVKDKCWLPSYSLLEIVQRENGQRKVPGPVLNTSKENSSTKTVLTLPVKKNITLPPASSITKASDKEIDYFDYQE